MNRVILLVVLLSAFTFAQNLNISFDTGDDDIDSYLNDVNVYAKANYDFFRKNLSLKFGISTREVDRYIYKEKVQPADLYYACAVSGITGKRVDDILVLYKDKKGWGAVAKELGIKPGSKEFHRLKLKSISGIGTVKSRNKENFRGNPKGEK